MVLDGTVQSLLVDLDFGVVKVRTPGNQVVSVLIWSYFIQVDTPENRMRHTTYLALLRDALINHLPVSVTTDDDKTTRQVLVTAT